MRNLKRSFALILCIVLVAAVALFAQGCKKNEGKNPETTDAVTTGGDTTDSAATKLGDGKKQFTFKVVLENGKEEAFIINTDEKTVGAALINLGLIEGDEGDYGLYVKKVNGVEADYEKTGTYWAFYVDGEYAMSGVDKTDIENDAEYSFKIEK